MEVEEGILEERAPIYKVVLTGGPCAGKTSAMTMIADHFTGLGWVVYKSWEAAALIITGGADFAVLNEEQQYSAQLAIIRLMMTLEDSFIEVSKLGPKDKPVLILCDRGIMDCSAYISEETFLKMLRELGKNSIFEVKDARYDAVIHLVTAAKGAEAHYTLENEAARSEGLEAAKDLDDRVLKAWIGHPHVTVINNRTNFKEKVLRATTSICNRFGVPSPSLATVKRKWLVNSLLTPQIPVHNVKSTCTYHCLLDTSDITQSGMIPLRDSSNNVSSSKNKVRLRMREIQGRFVYSLTTRVPNQDGTYDETRRSLRKREYKTLVKLAHPHRDPIVMDKFSFLFDDFCFDLCLWIAPEQHKGMLILETYAERAVEVKLPPYLDIKGEVTGNPDYSMYRMCKKKKS